MTLKYCIVRRLLNVGAACYVTCGVLLPVAASAQWSGEIGAGYVAASGNSDTQTLNGRAAVVLTTENFKHAARAEAFNTSDNDETTVERYLASYKADFNFTDVDFVFAAADFEKDLFGGIRRKTTQTLGYGRRLIETERQALNVELGYGLRQLRFQDPQGASESESIGRLSGDYRYTISDSSNFRQTLRVDSGSSNTSIESLSELRLSVLGNLFVSLSYTVRNNSDVAAGTEKTDTFTAVNLSYEYGS